MFTIQYLSNVKVVNMVNIRKIRENMQLRTIFFQNKTILNKRVRFNNSPQIQVDDGSGDNDEDIDPLEDIFAPTLTSGREANASFNLLYLQ